MYGVVKRTAAGVGNRIGRGAAGAKQRFHVIRNKSQSKQLAKSSLLISSGIVGCIRVSLVCRTSLSVELIAGDSDKRDSSVRAENTLTCVFLRVWTMTLSLKHD